MILTSGKRVSAWPGRAAVGVRMRDRLARGGAAAACLLLLTGAGAPALAGTSAAAALGAAGLAALSPVSVSSVSCRAAGSCTAVGYGYYSAGGHRSVQAFVVSEQNGRWGAPMLVPGLGRLSKGKRSSLALVRFAG